MRRLGRILLAAATALSLLLCVAAVAIWVASYLSPLRAELGDARVSAGYSVSANHGYLSAQRATGARRMLVTTTQPARIRITREVIVLGVHYVHVEDVLTGDPVAYCYRTEIWFSLGLPMVLGLPLTARWVWRLSRRRWLGSPGLCPSCGYDLRATPDRCPECGRAAAVSASGRPHPPSSP